MANVTGAELNPIYQRLNQVPTYHPFEANAFSDWSMEAGDMVAMMRDGEEYKSPVTVSRMVWKGNAPTVQISSTGNKEREPVSRISRKKYGRGSAGIRSQEAIHKNFTSEDGILHSELHVTESYLRTEFHNETSSLRSYFDITASHMQTAFMDEIHSTRSYVDITASHMQAAFADNVASMRSYVDITASHMQAAFTDDVNSLRSYVNITSSYLRTEFTDEVNSVRSYTYQTASSWEARVAPISDASGNITPASITLAINSAGSEARINANKIYLLGQTIADTIDANYISTKIADIPHLYTNHITMDGDLTLGGRLWLLGVNVTSLVSSVKSVRISGPTNNTYKLQYTTYDDDSWQDAGSFSRATSLSGAWSGRNFTVTATPQNEVKVGTVYNDIVPDTSDPVEYTTSGNNHYVARDYIVYSEDEHGDADTQILKKEVKISADLAYSDGYTTGYEEGAASGGTTTLTNTWNTGHLVVTASPQQETLDRWLSSGTATWNGTTVSIPVNALWGNLQQYSESTGWSASTDVSSKLQSKTFASNGTKTPDSGYIGFSSVSVSVPAADADARFGASSGQYFIGAYDNASGNLISGSNHTYKLGTSGAKVQVQKSDGTKHSSTPELTLAIDSGTLDTSTGSRTLTVTAGGNDTTATLDITDYSAGKNAVTVSSVAVNGTITYSSKILTVPTTATANNGETKTVNLSVNATQAYNAGWGAFYDALKWPTVPSTLSATFAVKRPNSTADSASDSQIRNYTLADKDNNTVYLRYNNETYAEINHGKYTQGYNSARLSLNTTSKAVSITSSGAITSYTLALMQDTRNTTAGNDYGKRKVWIKATPNSGSAIEVTSATISDYRDGWSAAYSRVSLPGNNTSSGYMVVGTPPSTVGGAKVETTYTLDTSDNNVAYIKQGSSIKAQVTHNKYTAGYNKGVDDYYGDYLVPVWGERYQDNYNANQYKQSNGTFIRKIHASASTGVHIPLSEDGANAGSANLTEIPSGGITANGNYKFRSGYAGIRYLNVNVPTSSSHSISQSHAYADNLATLASNLGASGSSALTNLGTFPAAGGRNYWGIRVKCGSAVKYYYVHTT